MLIQIEETTWGVELLEMSGERYVALPARTLVRPAFTVDGLDRILRHLRRRAKRQVEMTRRLVEMPRSRGPDRDHGPSR